MSPIRPSEAWKYPRDWKAIRGRILERARYACEWPGCGVSHGEWILRAEFDLEVISRCMDGMEAIDNYPPGWKAVLIILTIAHLDHDPANCADDNLRAWCQLHHLRYDAQHHAQTARATRRAKLGNGELFEVHDGEPGNEGRTTPAGTGPAEDARRQGGQGVRES